MCLVLRTTYSVVLTIPIGQGADEDIRAEMPPIRLVFLDRGSQLAIIVSSKSPVTVFPKGVVVAISLEHTALVHGASHTEIMSLDA